MTLTINIRLKMNKFKKATKRIAAVAASATLASAAVFGSLANYPNNFVENSSFNGQVVVGADAATMDTTSAMSIIDDLSAEFSGESERVRITYRSSATGGETLNAVKSTDQLNYGETLGAVTETAGFDNGDADALAKQRFDNDISDEDYEQKVLLGNGAFNYALRDNVDGVDEITDGIYYASGTNFANYTIEFDSSIALTASDYDKKLIGKELVIMGNEFTIADFEKDTSTNNTDKIVLLGGANKMSLGEGESATVTVDGEDYEVAIQSVSSSEVLLTVNGQSQSIDEFDTEEVGGITVAATDLVSSSRDAVKGYAEIVVGGQKVTLESGNIQVNDEDLDDIYPEYDIDVTFSGTGLETITIEYAVDDHTLLQDGDMLEDVLFDGFSIVYNGLNDVEYETFSMTTTDSDVSFSGTLRDGNAFPSDFKLYYDSEGSSGGNLYVGDDNYRIFHYNSTITDMDIENEAIQFNASSGIVNFTVTDTDIRDYGFFYHQDNDEQYLYRISDVATSSKEVDFNELIQDGDESDVGIDEWDTELVDGSTYVLGNTSSVVRVNVTNLDSAVISLANGLLANFAAVDDDALTATADAYMTFQLDSSEVDSDDSGDDDSNVLVWLGFPTDADDNLDLKINSSMGDIENSGNLADSVDGSSDTRVFVTAYGTMIEYDNDEYDSIEISVPDEQVYGMVDLVFGEAGGETQSVVVDADAADAKVEELEDDGYTIVDRETVESDEVEFDVSAPVLDTDVTGTSDMIVVGGPAVNRVAAQLLGLAYPTYGAASGVDMDEAVIRYFSDVNSVLVYGYEGDDTAAAATKLNAGGLSGNLVNVE